MDKFLIFSTTTECAHHERMVAESMRIVTRCKTPEQFVAAFQRFCDAETCFIPTSETRPVGSALAFSLRLADGTPVLRGSCIVKAVWPTKHNSFGRPGVQLEITRLHPQSEAIYEHMLAQKTAVFPKQSNGIVEPVTPSTTNKHVPRAKAIDLILSQGNAPVIRHALKPPPLPGARPPAPPPLEDDHATPTAPMPPLQYLVETRTPGSAIVLPVNPLSDVDEAALDAMLGCTLAEDVTDDDLAIPALPPAPTRRKTAPIAIVNRESVPLRMARGGTAPLVLDARPPAAPVMFGLHAMTHEERLWLLYALGAALLVAAIVLASAFVFAG